MFFVSTHPCCHKTRAALGHSAVEGRQLRAAVEPAQLAADQNLPISNKYAMAECSFITAQHTQKLAARTTVAPSLHGGHHACHCSKPAVVASSVWVMRERRVRTPAGLALASSYGLCKDGIAFAQKAQLPSASRRPTQSKIAAGTPENAALLLAHLEFQGNQCRHSAGFIQIW